MKIIESTVTKISIVGVEGLDPINVIFEDIGPKHGRFIIECWGECWSHYWGGMWDGHDVRRFFLACGDDYIAHKCVKRCQETDYEAISDKIGEYVGSDVDIVESEDLMTEHYGEDWRHNLPECPTHEYIYFRRILVAIKQALVATAEAA